MHAAMKAVAKRRKGVSLIEVMILIIVLMVTLGAVFSTMAWANKTYTFGRQDKESRELLFRWVQIFESMWPPTPADDPLWQQPSTIPAATLTSTAQGRIQRVGNTLGDNSATTNTATIGAYTVTAIPVASGAGTVDITITIRSHGKTLVRDLVRNYNIYTTDTVSDDVI